VIVKHSRDVYKVVAMTPAGFREDYFDYVVIALPINYLNTISFEGSGLENIIQDHYSTYNYPAHYLRFTILFKKPYWRSKMTESWCMLDQFGGCCLYDESSRIPDSEYGVLGWLLSGENAEKMSHYSDEELIEKALESLPKFMSEGREYFIEGHVHRWTNAVNAIPGGIFPKNLDKRHQPDSTKHPNLFFVGDYLFDSTLNGALDSANYVAHWIANLLIERKGEK
jgi:monoamine oxidase